MFFFANLNCLQGGVNNLITYTNINCVDLPKKKKKKLENHGPKPHILICLSAYLLQCCWCLLVFPTSKSEIISSCSHQPSSEALCWPPGDLADWGLDQVRGPNRGSLQLQQRSLFYLQTLWQDAADIKFTTVFYIHVNMYDIYIHIIYCCPAYSTVFQVQKTDPSN